MRLFTRGLAINANASPTKRLTLDTDIRPDQPDVPAKFRYLLCKYDEPHEPVKGKDVPNLLDLGTVQFD